MTNLQAAYCSWSAYWWLILLVRAKMFPTLQVRTSRDTFAAKTMFRVPIFLECPPDAPSMTTFFRPLWVFTGFWWVAHWHRRKSQGCYRPCQQFLNMFCAVNHAVIQDAFKAICNRFQAAVPQPADRVCFYKMVAMLPWCRCLPTMNSYKI